MHYMVLSRMANDSHELAFPVRPEHHVASLFVYQWFCFGASFGDSTTRSYIEIVGGYTIHI